MTTKAKSKAKSKAKTGVVYLATIEYTGYELRCCAETEEEAKKAVLAEMRRCNKRDFGSTKAPTRFAGDMTAEEFWEYAGGNVTEMPMGKVVWP